MFEFQSVQTKIGLLVGRDAIFLNEYRSNGHELTVEGEFSGTLASEGKDNYSYPYIITFSGVQAIKVTELDAYESSTSSEGWSPTSFDQVVSSVWIKELNTSMSKINDSDKHFIFQTYDYVFEIICPEYNLEISE